MAIETIEIDVVANYRDNFSAGIGSATHSTDRFLDSVRRTQREVDKLDGQNAKPKIGVVDKASSTLSKIDRSLTSLGRMAIKAPVRILDYATKPLRAIKDSLFSIKGLVMAIGTGWAANKLLAEPISLADSYSSAKIGFSTLLGDSAGQKMMDDLDDFAKATPFKTSGVIENAQKMMSMGWDAESIIDDMRIIGDAAAATGKMDQGLESIVRALSQIKTKGKLSTEELNQLAEAGIAAKAMLAENLGYGTGDSGIAKMTEDLEDGAIQSDKAIQALLQGMKQFEGTMEKTANETVEGLKSQIEDTFEINILRKWGQGLQDGAKRGFGSIIELLDKSEGSLAKFGDTVYEIGKELSNWAADKLENTIDKVLEITNRADFKDASLGGKIKILWNEVIAEPFGKWWDTTGQPFMVEKMASFGEALGSSLSKGLLTLLGVDVTDAGKDAMSIGSSFASGFAKGFEGEKVWDAIVNAAGKAFTAGLKALFQGNALSKIIAGGISLKIASGITSGISKAVHLWYGEGPVGGLYGTSGLGYEGGGIKGFLGGASTASGSLVGSGLIGTLAKLGSKATGHGGLLGKTALGMTAQTGGGLALAGGITAAGIVGGVAGLGNSVADLAQAVQAQTKNDKTLYSTRSGVKAGMVGTGALIGTMFAPGIGTAIGAGLGGIATYLAGNKLADSISGVSKSTAELTEEAEKLAAQRMADRFGEITLSAEQLAGRVKEVFGADTINKVNKFNQSMADLQTIQSSASNYKNDIDYTYQRIMGKEKLSDYDVEDYKNTLVNYADSVAQALTSKKTSSIDAFKLLFGDDTKSLQTVTEKVNKTYSELESKLESRTKELNETISKAFEDGEISIDEEKTIHKLINQIDNIYNEIEKHIEEKEKAKNEAALDLLEMKYKDTDLTADSFKTLVSELDKQGEVNQKAYDDAYIEAKAELDLELKTNPKYTKEQYQKDLEVVEKKWREGKAVTVKQGVEVSLNVLKTNYKDEFNGLDQKFSNILFTNSQLNTVKQSSRDLRAENVRKRYGDGKDSIVIDWTKDTAMEFEDMKDQFLSSAHVDKAAQEEFKAMYEALKPQEEDLLALKKSYEDAGEKIPQWINDSLADIANIKLMSGDMDSFYTLIGEQLALSDEKYAQALLDAKAKGEEIPQALIDGVEKGLKNADTIDVATNLKVTANKKDIDTSNLDKTTKDVVEEMQSEGILEINKKGQVTVKTKDGKIDTTNLDEDTKKALEKLEKDGAIKVNKDGTVTFNVTEVETKQLDEQVEQTLLSLEKEGLLEVEKDGKVKISADGGIDIDDVNEKTETALRMLEEAGILEIDKNGIVTVNASVNINGQDEKTKNEIENALGNDQNLSKTANVAVDSNTTGEDTAASKSKEEVKSAVDRRFGITIPETGKVNVSSISLNGVGTSLTSAWSLFRQNVANKFNRSIYVTPQIKYRIGTPIGSSSDSNDPKKANGGYVDKAIRTIVGEAGPEMIIPLSSNRRQRGKSLWERAGRAMGLLGSEEVYLNANGGLYGIGASKIDESTPHTGSKLGEMLNSIPSVNQSETTQTINSNPTVNVEVGGIQITVQGSGGNIANDIQQQADDIAKQIASMLKSAFENMPIPAS